MVDMPSARDSVSPTVVPIDPYDNGIPKRLIEQNPVEPRSAARSLAAPELCADGEVARTTMADLPYLLRPGDVLVVNDTRNFHRWSGQVHRRPRRGAVARTGGRCGVVLGGACPAGPGPAHPDAAPRVRRRAPGGRGRGRARSSRRRTAPRSLIDRSVVERAGTMPLPPYIHHTLADPDRYQTVYSAPRALGEQSAAAPTAGLHSQAIRN